MKFNEIEGLFESATIKPTFEYIHVILALYLFGKEEGGIGRYRLKEELLIGSGTARSLIEKLNERINFITVLSEKNKKKGHILTKVGQAFLDKLKEKIPLVEEGDLSILKEILIESENLNSYYCLIKNAAGLITNGIKQRDAAIKIEGSGATCLVYNGNNLTFPPEAFSDHEMEKIKISDTVQEYFKSSIARIKFDLERNDVIIIGLGESPEKARLAAMNAALTLI
jgi:hypothetical protein